MLKNEDELFFYHESGISWKAATQHNEPVARPSANEIARVRARRHIVEVFAVGVVGDFG